MKLLRETYKLIAPYGIKKLLIIALAIVAQGIVQTAGVASIMPFLAIAADPAEARRSEIGSWFVSKLPSMTDQSLLLAAGLLSIFSLFATNLIALCTVYVTQHYMCGISHWLRSRLIWQIAAQDYAYFLNHSTAVMMKKVNGDARGIAQQILRPMLQLISGSVNTVLLAAALVWIDPLAAVLATAVFSVSYIFIFSILRRFRQRYSTDMKEIMRETNRKAMQLFGGIKPIKVQGVEWPFLNEFDCYSRRESKLVSANQIFSVAPKQLIEPIVFGTLVIVIMIAYRRGESMISLIPTLGLMTMAAYRLLPNFQSIYVAATMIGSSRHVLEEVLTEFETDVPTSNQLIRRQSSMEAPLKWSQQIRFDNVSFAYNALSRPVISSLDLTIPKNSSIAFVGTTGCGKSTLIDLMLGLHTPTSGAILVDNKVLEPQIVRSWRKGIGYVPQDIFLLDDTIQANIALGVPEDDIDHNRLRGACQAAQILDLIEQDLPRNWTTHVGERGVRLSGGQRQRIGLARALYGKPEMLILDEATSALDNATEAAVMESIQAIKGGVTLVIVAHRTSTVQWCDQIISLKISGADAS